MHGDRAWFAARGIVAGTHDHVIVEGEFGTAHFNHDGSGRVEWNEKSGKPGTTTTFDERATVLI
jgi:hypothetical protein